ncbi:PKD domain-containing protein [Roseateles sp. SL47]|uniref:PKD domain-containing protein n=1 Tax=Roseateles sp. SL47 TaxID=2995138 RepID=UPI00226DA5E2|nr:PKD domain-containing protein [Roseateles sp. SL47]WAC73233.1 PKD domain-containing protein [Roseateles sp. SL47]
MMKRSGRFSVAALVRPVRHALLQRLCSLVQSLVQGARLLLLALLMACSSAAQAGINTGLVGDDVVAGPFPIGFSFTYYNQPVTQFYVTTNGLIQFSSPTTAYSNSCLPALSNTIFVFWDDLRTDVSGQPTGKIQYETLGEAPNRKLVVQWTNQYFYGSNLPMGTFQAVLHEGSNQITLQYRYLRETLSTGGSATIGIQGPSNQASSVGCNQSNVIAPQQAIAFVPDAGGTTYAANAAAPYEFIDISGLTPEPPQVLRRYTNAAPEWTWAKVPDLNTYQIEIQSEAGDTLLTQTVGDVSSFTWPDGLVSGATYRARVRGSVNSGGTWELWSGLSQPVTIDQVLPTGQLQPPAQTGPSSVEWRFSATDALSGVDQIRLQIASDAAFSTVLQDSAFSAGTTNYTYTAAVAGQRLYGRIIVRDAAGNLSEPSAATDVLVLPPPQAAFAASALTGEAPLTVVFQNQSSGETTSYLWNFGDGRTSAAPNPSIRYTQPGTYTVVLRATGVGGFTLASRDIVVTPDVTQPVVQPPTINGAPLASPLLVQKTETLRFAVSDAGGVASVRAELSATALTLQNLGSNTYQLSIDPLQFANGDYVLSLGVTDVAGNTTTYTSAVRIDLPPPVAPVLTSSLPARTNQSSVRVRGTSPLGAEAQFQVNGVAQGDWVPITSQVFEADIALSEGPNQITAVVRNNRGTSVTSQALAIVLDTSKPAGPSALTASSQAQGKIKLAWTSSKDAASVGHLVWRATFPFDTPSQGSLLTASPLTGASLEDLPPVDGSYYYRVASVNALGTFSALSNLVQATADNTSPQAVSITYTSLGKVDLATGRYGQGRINLVLTTSEPLQSTPYLSVVPQGGVPIPVELVKAGDTVYNGNFLLDANTPSGVANVLFSARDLVGNRGTDVLSGATLRVDTEGPALSGITLNPAAPLKNEGGAPVQATFVFSKAPAQTPQVRYGLSGPLRTPVSVGTLTQLNATTYTASFTLPGDAGLGGSEILSFNQQARDDLDNVSSKVSAFNRHQVYQGNLPPLDAPFGFSAKAQPGGKVRLSWQAVTDATSYQIYRQTPGTSLQPLARSAGIEYIDQTPADGRYSYAVATVRQANGQESLSAQTAAIEVLASATAPGAPQNLALTLTGQGIYAAWQPPLNSTVDYYNLYRAHGTSITSIEGLTPLKTRIKTPQTYDTAPSPTQGAYVVTAVDAAGNESPISNSAYLNASLLPVRDVRVEQLGSELPTISWAAPNGNVSGYLVYVGPDSSRTRLTPSPITSTRLTDSGFSAGERRYTIASVDANGVELPRTVVLPHLSSQIVSGLPIQRGVINKLQVQLTNVSAFSVTGVRAVVRLPTNRDATQFKDHKSAPLTLGPNQTQLVPVIVGGYADLPGAPSAEVGVEVTNEGESVKIARSQTVDVTEGSLVVGMATDEFTRGGTGKLKLTIENSSEVDVELLTATGNGANESSELRFKLLDADNNILATQSYKQVFGANVVTLPNGLTVARIPAGSAYVSDTFNLNVPGASPNSIRVRLEVDKLRYHSGEEDEVQITGRGSERTVSLSDTAYLGEVTQVGPISSYGDQDILISGRALDRSSRLPLPNARLKLILNQQGFERSFNVLTDGAGEFVYTFKPTLTDAGLYKVSAVHPDITDRPEQKVFTINRVTVGPTPYKLDLPRNYAFTIPLTARAGAGTSASNVRLALNAASQPTGQIPAGVRVDLPAPVSLTERQTLNLPVQFTANNEAQPTGSLIFDVLSDEHANTPMGQVRVDFTLSEAKPYLVSTPSLVETGLVQGGSQLESVTVKNNGLQDAINLQFVLTKADGSPAPAWASIGSAANGTLAIGQSRPVDLAFSPPAGTPEGVYEFKLTVSGDNLPSQSLNVYVSLTQSGQGHVLFKAADIYTATIGKDGKLIPGLAGATITLQNEDVATITQELLTDSLGEAMFQNLPAGRYKFRARASNHQDIGGRVLIKPGITANQSVFLDYNLITVEWSVREITIQDRYEITLNATFETDVPAAVVVMQPTSINLPKMAAGDVYYGELSLTNYGLIRADHVQQRLPQSDAYFRYEFLVEVPGTLEAKQRVVIPYRVIALQPLDVAASSGTASGGGCYSYSNVFAVTCDFQCANGSQSSCGASSSWFAVSSSSCPGGGSGGGGGGGWGGGGFGGSGSSTPIKLKGKKCVYVPKGGMQCD